MAAWISTGTLSHKDQPSQRSSRAAVRALDRKVPPRANAGMTERPTQREPTLDPAELDRFGRLGLRMVGRQRKVPHAASNRAGTADVSARPAAGTFRERPGRGLAVFGTALDSRRGLRRRPGVRAAGAAGRGDDGDRSRRQRTSRLPAGTPQARISTSTIASRASRTWSRRDAHSMPSRAWRWWSTCRTWARFSRSAPPWCGPAG